MTEIADHIKRIEEETKERQKKTQWWNEATVIVSGLGSSLWYGIATYQANNSDWADASTSAFFGTVYTALITIPAVVKYVKHK